MSDLKNLLQQAQDLLSAQSLHIEKFQLLCDTQQMAMGWLGEALTEMAQVCLKVSEITDDPEVLVEMAKCVKICEDLQSKAQTALADIEGDMQ